MVEGIGFSIPRLKSTILELIIDIRISGSLICGTCGATVARSTPDRKV